VADFCVAIQKLAEHCEFGTTLNDALCDRLVCGLVNENIQRKLLVEADLTYDCAKSLASAAEMAVKDAVELRAQAAAAANVNKVFRPGADEPAQPMSTKLCSRYGNTNHIQSDCYFKEKVCNNCSKKGHCTRMCR